MLRLIDARPSLQLSVALRERVERWARELYPREACGFVLGRASGASRVAVDVRLARNLEHERALERFDLDPADHLAIEEEARARGLVILALWHSHPDRSARPSEADREYAWNGWSHVIVSLGSDGAAELRSWRVTDAFFDEEELLP
jgi:proteasome lid subunit RPN8/RPN11